MAFFLATVLVCMSLELADAGKCTRKLNANNNSCNFITTLYSLTILCGIFNLLLLIEIKLLH